MFAAGLGPIADSAFAVASMLIAIPTGVKIFNWLATLWRGNLRPTTAFHFAVGLVSMFTLGGLSGVMHASAPIDLQKTDSYFVVAHLHYVLIGGSLFGLFAAIYYWWPKMTGRFLDERLGHWNFWLIFLAFNLTFFPQHYLGAIGMQRRIYTYATDTGWGFWNLMSTIGASSIGASVVVFLINAWWSLRGGAPAPGDPWDGRTLEWRTTSPPPAHDFDEMPPVYGRDTFWREKRGLTPRARLAPGLSGVTAVRTDPGPHAIHLPSPSIWPIVVALGILVTAMGR